MSKKQFPVTYLVLVLVMIVSLTVGVTGGAAAGGLAGYFLANQKAQALVSGEHYAPAGTRLAGRGDSNLVEIARQVAQPLATVELKPKATPPDVSPLVASASDAEDLLLENIYERINPAVVNIQVTSKAAMSQAMPNFPDIPGFQNPFRNLPQGQQPREFLQQGEGSGFVYDTEGRIVTNNHVVDGAQKIRVTFYDDVSVPAEVVGTDPDSDLAVIKVDPKGLVLKPLTLGSSQDLKVGQQVIAIGNPFGLKGTMTTGIVSALGRSLPTGSQLLSGGRYTIPDVVQTDAAINPGNSGGPLLNSQGEVVGVNSAIESPVRASAGVGFAIPSRIVNMVVPKLLKSGKVEYPWLGISGTTLNPQLNEAMSLPAEQRGVLVAEVSKGGPAEKADLKASAKEVDIDGEKVTVGGDIIIGIDQEPVRKFDDLLTYLVYNTESGQTVTVTVLRNGETQKISVKLATRPAPSTRQTEPASDSGQ